MENFLDFIKSGFNIKSLKWIFLESFSNSKVGCAITENNS